MENNFDKAIKQKMEQFEAEYQPSAWDRMEERIEANSALNPELEDVMLDGVAYERLQQFEVPYDPEHWSLMRERLDATYALRRKLMKYKVAEVSLVILFIFTLVQFLPIKKDQAIPLAGDASPPMELATVAEPNIEQFAAATELNSPVEQQTSGPLSSNQAKANTTSTTTSPNTSLAFAAGTPPVPPAAEAIQTGSSDNQSAEVASIVPANSSALPSEDNATPSATKVDEQPNPIAETLTMESINETMTEQEAILAMSPMALKSEELLVGGVEELKGTKVFSDLKKPLNIRIGMALGMDANYVMTPAHYIYLPISDKFQKVSTFNSFYAGYSGGLILGFQYGDWEIETGAIYSAITYDLRQQHVLLTGNTEEGFALIRNEQAQLDIVRLPLNLKYNVYSKNKWRLYMHSGGTVNFTGRTFYNFTTRDVNERSQGAAANLQNSRGTVLAVDNDIEPENYNGIFEGGSFSNNTFFTADLGFGVERYFTPRMSVFVQPNFRYQFSRALGPQKDRINSVSILAGAKVNLKKRKKYSKKIK